MKLSRRGLLAVAATAPVAAVLPLAPAAPDTAVLEWQAYRELTERIFAYHDRQIAKMIARSIAVACRYRDTQVTA